MHTRLARVAAASFTVLLASPALGAFGDGTPPTISTVSPTAGTAGSAFALSASVSDASGIQSCALYVESNEVGTMTVSNGTASILYAFAQAGVHTAFVFCRDMSGAFGSGPNTAVVITASGNDQTPPSVGAVGPLTAPVGLATVFSANVSDVGTGIASCSLYVNGEDKGAMAVANGVASKSHTFTSAGSYTIFAQCTDAAGNSAGGTTKTVTVGGGGATTPPPEPELSPPATPVATGLVKLACPALADANHPCRAVYYRGRDGKRHAFPNDRIYHTWYADFSSVQTASATDLAALPLGETVTYRPGVRLVKFSTVPKVYAVGRDGLLRWITTENAATTLYGAGWNTMIDDLSDAFFVNYRFGDDVAAPTDFAPQTETSAAPTIDDNMML